MSRPFSRRQLRAIDRASGADFMIPWPSDLPPGKPVEPDHWRPASPAERAAALRSIGNACRAGNIVVHRVRAVRTRYPRDWHMPGDLMALAVTLRTARWTTALPAEQPEIWPEKPPSA